MEADTRIHSQQQAVNDYFLNNLSNGYMLCKLSQVNTKRNSDKNLRVASLSSIGYILDQNLSGGDMIGGKKKSKPIKIVNKLKIKLQSIQKSKNFFKNLPFFQEVSSMPS